MNKITKLAFIGVGLASALILSLWVSDALAQNTTADLDGDGCTTFDEIVEYWGKGAAEAQVTLTFDGDLSEDAVKVLAIKARNLAGSNPPWEFNDIWTMTSSGGTFTAFFIKDDCAVGRLTLPTEVWDAARSTEARAGY